MTTPMPEVELLAKLWEHNPYPCEEEALALLTSWREACGAVDRARECEAEIATLRAQLAEAQTTERQQCAQIAHLEYLRYAQQGSDRAAGGKEIDADRSYARAGTAKQIATLILDGVEPDIPAALAEANKRIAELETENDKWVENVSELLRSRFAIDLRERFEDAYGGGNLLQELIFVYGKAEATITTLRAQLAEAQATYDTDISAASKSIWDMTLRLADVDATITAQAKRIAELEAERDRLGMHNAECGLSLDVYRQRIAELEAGLDDLRSAVTSEGEHGDEMIDEEYGDCDICTALRRARALLSSPEPAKDGA
jgi:chromosome segregation ATPase